MARLLSIFVITLSFIIVFSKETYAGVPFDTKATHAILLDDATGTVLFEKNSDQQMVPSSMSKLMTAYIVFDHLKKGKLKLEDKLPVSEKAWKMQGSKMFVSYNDQIPVEALIQGVVVQSGNDACIVLAEGIAGSEESFANNMNYEAKELGLKGSHFKNATGWPDPEHVMTAHDLAILASRLYHDFPEYYPYFKESEYTYNGIRQFNRNVLLHRDIGVDGLKTGHTQDGGYGITISGEQDGRRLIVVVNGLTSEKERAEEAGRLLQYGFRNFENVRLFKQGEPVEQAEVWFGEKETVPLTVAQDVVSVLPKYWLKDDTKITVTYEGPVKAPIEKGTEIAKLTITSPEIKTIEVPLVAAEEVKSLPMFAHIMRAAEHYILGSN